MEGVSVLTVGEPRNAQDGGLWGERGLQTWSRCDVAVSHAHPLGYLDNP